jgi:large subunit ribosomal protein L17
VRHGDKVKKLGRREGHRAALLKNLVAALFIHERIRTTLPKAREARRLAERLIAYARQNTLASRREAARTITDKTLLKKLFDVIGPRFADRSGGWTRVLRLGPRPGDAAEMALLELVVREESHKEKRAKEAAAKEKGGRKAKTKAEKKPGEPKKGRGGDKAAE